jgi:FixJ family two-component response regulator
VRNRSQANKYGVDGSYYDAYYWPRRVFVSAAGVVVTSKATELPSAVFVVDDDASIREALDGLFRSIGLQAKTFGSAAEFLQHKLPDAPSCLVLDVRLPGLSGLDFQAELAAAGLHIPIIFMTGHGDIPMTVKAMKAGAIEFLPKPFRDQDMLDAVQQALERDRERRERNSGLAKLKSSFDTLTPREQEVMSLVTTGLMNKQVAGEIGVSEITAKVHRGNIMRKMGAKSLAELVRMADALGVRRPSS